MAVRGRARQAGRLVATRHDQRRDLVAPLEDMSLADVAAALDIAEGTVKASLFKARANLARTLQAPISAKENG